MRLVPTGHFLFFASPKKRKQKKGDCGCRFGCAKLPSLHTIFRADKKLAALLFKQFCPYFPEKSRSTRLRQQERCFVVNVLDGI